MKKDTFFYFIIAVCSLFAMTAVAKEAIVSDLLIDISLTITIASLTILASHSALEFIKDIFLKKKTEKEEKLNASAEYDRIREYLESEIAKLQKQMITTPSNWKESYHLLLAASEKGYSSGPIQLSNFINRFNLTEQDMQIDRKKVFFLTPFNKKSFETYMTAKHLCSDMGLNLYRGDELYTHHDILSTIIRYIVSSRIIIANLDGKNPNVFYELGIAHALGKPTILISQAIDSVPFDVQNNRIIIYRDNSDLEIQLEKALMQVLTDS